MKIGETEISIQRSILSDGSNAYYVHVYKPLELILNFECIDEEHASTLFQQMINCVEIE